VAIGDGDRDGVDMSMADELRSSGSYEYFVALSPFDKPYAIGDRDGGGGGGGGHKVPAVGITEVTFDLFDVPIPFMEMKHVAVDFLLLHYSSIAIVNELSER
jgi:hypothetical protein